MFNPIFIKEGYRILKKSSHRRCYGTSKIEGNPKQICQKITDRCWNSRFFQTSLGHFNQFWTRDFGFCIEALLKLGYKNQVHKTLDYALDRFSKYGEITTTISPNGKPYNFPKFASDSLPLLIRSLKITKANDLIDKHIVFLIKEIGKYYNEIFDAETSMVKKFAFPSSIKDYSKRKSATYDNCMLAMLKNDLAELNIYNPFEKFNIKNAIIENLWNGNYFYDDLTKQEIVTGDANVFPFWCGVVDSEEMFKKCLKAMKFAKLDSLFPLKYTNTEDKINRMSIYEVFVGDYERDTIWMHLGLCFLDMIKKYNKKLLKPYLNKYNKLIEKHSTFLEVYDRNGQPFKTAIYQTDEGMLWACKMLVLA